MKLKKRLYYIFTAICFFSFGLTVSAQQSFRSSQNIALSKVLQQLKQEKQVTFLYEPATIKGIIIKTPFNYKDDTKTILKKILPPVGLKSKKIGKKNFVIKKAKKRTLEPNEELSQSKFPILKEQAKTAKLHQVSGILSSKTDETPLIGATVRIKGTSIGTTTNINGEFQLEIPTDEQILVFSYIGYQEKEVLINGKSQLKIYLKEATNDLNEIIVTAIGLENLKRELAYSTDNLDVEDLARTYEPNLVTALAGRTAGIWINSASGSPGASASVFIRGMRSVNGSNKPLFVLDGVPIDNTTTGNGTGGVDVSNRLIDLNLHDIEKITVLKGASATALYGIRAANGAIILTSKKGNQGRPKVRFSTTYGFSQVSQLPEKQTLYAQGKYQNGIATFRGPETNTSSSYGPLVSELEFDGDENYPYDLNGRLVPKGQGNGQPANIYDANNSFFVKGQTLDNHLAISGGTNWFDYYLSFGQFKETGVVPRSMFERYSLKGSFNIKLHEKVKIGMSSYLNQANGYRMKRGSLFSGVPLGLFRNPVTFDIGNGQTGHNASQTPSAYMFENGEQRAFRGNGRYDNPFWSVNRNPFEDKVNRLIQNIHLDYQMLPWLKTVYRVGLDVYTDNRKNAYDINSGTHRLGQINVFDIKSNNINSDLLLIAEKRLNENWNLKSTFGHNYYSSNFSIEETIGEELEKQGVYQISNAIYTSTEETLLQKKVAGIYTDVHLRYKNIWYFNFTGRKDWSSTLPINNNSFFYPSFSVGFEFTEWLDILKSSPLSYGKMRLSASQVGNDAGTYLTDTYFNPAVTNGDDLLPNLQFPAFGVSAFERSAVLGNANLKPETTNAYEIGAELKWLNGRIETDITIYKAIHKDQIINTQLSAASGFLSMPTNGGTIENQGIELKTIFQIIDKKDFNWNMTMLFSKFESIVTDLPNNNAGIVLASFSNISSMILEGEPYGVLVGSSIKKDENGTMIIDQDGFPKVNEMQTIIGNPTPDWLMSINQGLEWKNFRLNVLLDIRKGGDIWNGTRGVMSFLGVSEESGALREVRDYVFDGVTETGEVNTKPVDFANPENGMRGIYWRRYGFIGLAEAHIEDGSWFRIRELSLTYQFAKKWNERTSSDITVSIFGNNIFLKTKYLGVDPETNLRGDSNIMGWDYFTMPSTKSWTLQMKIVI